MRSRRSAAVASASMVTTRFHGIMASDASSSPKSIARSSNAAWLSVRWPLSADESTIKSSSSVDTAPRSSSTGSTPISRNSRFAAPSNSRMTGPATRRNTHIDGARARATGSGFAIAKFFGASSPNTICAMVANINASVIAIPNVADSGRPTATSAGSINEASAGSAMKPNASVVTVIPNCAPDSMKLRRLCMSIARFERRSPSSARSLKRLRRAATNANSTATK